MDHRASIHPGRSRPPRHAGGLVKAAARDGRHGLQVMSFDAGGAVRLAGGFIRDDDDESLRAAINPRCPTPMGELESIKGSSRHDRRGGRHPPKLARRHRPDRRAGRSSASRRHRPAGSGGLDQLPSGMMRPLDIVAVPTARIGHAPAVPRSDGDRRPLTELSPCWRPLLDAPHRPYPVQWTAGPRSVPLAGRRRRHHVARRRRRPNISP